MRGKEDSEIESSGDVAQWGQEGEGSVKGHR